MIVVTVFLLIMNQTEHILGMCSTWESVTCTAGRKHSRLFSDIHDTGFFNVFSNIDHECFTSIQLYRFYFLKKYPLKNKLLTDNQTTWIEFEHGIDQYPTSVGKNILVEYRIKGRKAQCNPSHMLIRVLW